MIEFRKLSEAEIEADVAEAAPKPKAPVPDQALADNSADGEAEVSKTAEVERRLTKPFR